MWTPFRPTEMGRGSNSVGFMVSEGSLHRTCFPVDCWSPLTLVRFVMRLQPGADGNRLRCLTPPTSYNGREAVGESREIGTHSATLNSNVVLCTVPLGLPFLFYECIRRRIGTFRISDSPMVRLFLRLLPTGH